MKEKELAPLWGRIVVFLMWPVIAVGIWLFVAMILICAWPLVFTHLTLNVKDDNRD